MKPDRFHYSPANAERDRAEAARLREYERRKQAWIEADSQKPVVTPGTYEAAMRQIAKECGI